MPHARPTPPRPRRSRTRRGRPRLLLVLALGLVALPPAGCVEISRTERGRYGNPLESYSSGPRNTFDAENYKPPERRTATKPWYQRLFDW